MGRYEERTWEGNLSAPGKRNRRAGTYRAFIPTALSEVGAFPPDLARRAARIEKRFRNLDESGFGGFESLSRFLLRSEAVASSRIEGLQVGAKRLATAELVHEASGGGREPDEPYEVIRGISALKHAATTLAELEVTEVGDLEAAQMELVGQGVDWAGVRSIQNWVGGSDHHPLDAEYIPPPPEELPALLEDLLGYLDGAAHGALIQAALVHAQFETIHPFADGNGRIGRALIHTVLIRRGLSRSASLPISVALRTRGEEYVAGLSAFRAEGESNSQAVREGRARWLEVFLAACEVALEKADALKAEVNQLHGEWAEQHLAYWAREKAATSSRSAPREDAGAVRLRKVLHELPVLTVERVGEYLGLGRTAANAACNELADAQILTAISISRGIHGWYQRDLCEMITDAERALASTQWDTALSPPVVPVPKR
ncbi:Fic family protein [Dermabacteraceae bacterium TAE3-ERU5]|nr:Fic family protein [Dermabacteraceae bacterium TAE3-ERU5]